MPPFGDYLVCGFSTQLHQQVVGLDEILFTTDSDFVTSGLRATSLIRLGFLTIVAHSNLIGAVGFVSAERHERLLRRLSEYLTANISQ